MCETLMPDVVVPETHQKDRSYVREISEPTYFRFTTQECSMVGGYTEDLKKPQNCQNWGVSACPEALVRGQ